MIEAVRFEKLTKEYYRDYLSICAQDEYGSVFLPFEYQNNLWGTIALYNEKLVGGWVGTLRGNKPVLSYFVKGVWFDSYPVFTKDISEEIISNFVQYTKQEAKQDNIVLFNLTHWVRHYQGQYKDFIDIKEKNASFIINLENELSYLKKQLNKSTKAKLSKSLKSNIDFEIYQGSEIIEYIQDFQELRKVTQKRSILVNKKSSMLLKSDEFIMKITEQTDAVLFLTKQADNIVSTLLTIKNNNTIYSFLGGSNSTLDRQTGASGYLYWKIVEWAKSEGLKWFDLGGAPVNPNEDHPAFGVFKFKRGFGGEYKEFNSGKVIISTLKYPLFNLFFKQRKLLRLLSKSL